MKELKTRLHAILEEKDQLSAESQDLTKKKAKLELDIKDIQDEMEGNNTVKVGCDVCNNKKLVLFI